MDQTGDAYVTGHTSSANLPVTGTAFQSAMHGTGDVFVTKFPLGGTFRVLQVVPSSGGNSGNFTATIIGGGFHAGLSVKLSGGGQPDILATNIMIGPNSLYITPTFNLQGTTTGTRDVVVTNPDGATITLPQAFMISQGGLPQLQVTKTGTPEVPGRAGAYTITLSNTGAVDAGTSVLAEYLEPWFTLVSSNPVPSRVVQGPDIFPESATGNYGAVLQWDVPTLPAGSSKAIS